jgi:hypothetical protein
MYKVSDKFSGCSVFCDKFSVILKSATQEQLEHLFHLGHKGIEFIGKKYKNKPIDNFSNESNTELTNEQKDSAE